MNATYVSIFDDHIRCESACNYDPTTKVVSNIETAENSEEADNANALTDEFVCFKDGKELRKNDGVTFDY